MMHERERRRANVSTISGKRRVKSFAWTTIEPHSLTILAGDDSESIVLDLMQPQAAGRQRVGLGGEARRNEAGRKSTRTGKHDGGIDRQRWSRLEGPRGYGLASRASTCPLCGGGRWWRLRWPRGRRLRWPRLQHGDAE